jgi:phosphate/sulfate permease
VVGAPVSTTHVLSSAVAGSMAAGGSGLQPDTLRSVALAWLLTLPASLFLGAVLFLASRALLG